MPNIVITSVALLVAFAACVTDVRSRRIPNLLTFGAAAAAVIFHAGVDGVAGFGTAIGGWVAGTVLFLPFFVLGGMGAGDVKLLGALGAWLGPREALWVAMYASLAGGVMAVAVALARGYWFLVGPQPMPGLTLERSEGPRLAYALPIFAGAVVAIWLR
jgi:prepilin peptidase CpaA